MSKCVRWKKLLWQPGTVHSYRFLGLGAPFFVSFAGVPATTPDHVNTDRLYAADGQQTLVTIRVAPSKGLSIGNSTILFG